MQGLQYAPWLVGTLSAVPAAGSPADIRPCAQVPNRAMCMLFMCLLAACLWLPDT